MKTPRTLTTFLLAMLMLLHLQLKAQVNITTQILPPYPTKFTDYVSHPQLLLISVTNVSTTPQRVQLRGNITGDNGIEIRVKQSYKSRTAITLNPGETRALNGNDIGYFFDYTQLSYTGITQTDFIKKNGLPEGSYHFCVRAYNYDTNSPLSADEPLGCSNTFSLSSLEPPTILSPFDQDSISAAMGQIVNIRWNTPGTTPPSIRYHIRMVEILGKKSPNNAIMSATQPYFFDKEVMGNSYIYNPADPMLTPGRSYALMVEAFDPFNQTPFRNNGRSEVISFTYKAAAVAPPATTETNAQATNTHHSHTVTHEPTCSCQATVPSSTTDNNNDVKVASQIKVNNFTMKVASVSKQPDGTLTGTGTIAMPFIGSLPGASLRVSFEDLTVLQSAAGSPFTMLGGSIEGIVSNNAVGFTPPSDEPMSLSQDKVGTLGDYLKTTSDHLLSSVKNSASSAGFELPLSLNTGPVNVGIMRVHFTAKQAWFDAAAAVDIPDGNTKLGLVGKDICMSPDNLCGQGQLYLSDDLAVSEINITLKKHNDDDAASGTSIAFDKGGFKSLHIDAEFKFPDGTLINTSGGGAAKLYIKTDTEKGWDDWVAYATVDPFNINGIADFKFMMIPDATDAQKLVYDHSSTRNAANMPTHIDSGDGQSIDTSSPTWEGLFIPSLQVELPSAIKSKNGQPIRIAASNMIFQGGFTGYIHTLAPPLTLDNGSLNGWFFSVDNIGISFFQNSLTSGSMNGRFMLPASGSDIGDARNQLNYSCNLTSSGGGLNFKFQVKPNADVNFSALWAKVQIQESSNITITGGSNGFNISALLNGSMVIQPEINNLPDITLGYMTFRNMKFSTTDGFSPGQFGVGVGSPPATGALNNNAPLYSMANFHGPNTIDSLPDADNIFAGDDSQQSLMGFNFSIDSIAPYVEPGKLGITFYSRMQLVNGVSWIPKAKLGFSIFAKTDAGSGGHQWWERFGGDINTIELNEDADLGGMKIKGSIKYFNTQSDRGFAGALQVVLPGLGTNIGMKGLFGSRKKGNNSFQYFYVDAMFDLGNTGIMMYPGTALYGFAGGAYYNMQRSKQATYAKPASAMPDATDNQYTSMQSFSGATYTPVNAGETSFGFLAGVYFGLQSRNVFEGQLTFSMEFKNGSLNEVALDGKGDILNNGASTFDERYAKALGQIDIGIKVDFNNNHFWKLVIDADATLKYPPVNPLFTATGSTELYIENMAASDEESDKNVRWYFKAGVPWDAPVGQPMTLTLDAKIFKVGAKSYFECGNYNIDQTPALPPMIQNILNMAKSEDNGGKVDNNDPHVIVSQRENSESGMIMGAMVEFEAHPQFAIFYADLWAGLGADFSLKFYNQGKGETPCSTSNASWYATGKAFIGAQAACGVHINVFGIKKDVEFVKAGVAAVVSAGAPSPLYAQGTLGGYFSVLDGLVKGHFSIDFTVGEVCSNIPDNDQLALVASLSPGTDDGAENTTLTRPAVSFNFPLTTDFVVPLTNAETHETTYTLFRFDRDYVTIDITGGSQHFGIADMADQYGKKKSTVSRGIGTPNYTLSLAADAPSLLPLTQYTFSVKAKVKKYELSPWINSKEALTPLQNKLGNDSFVWVKDGNKIYEDPKSVSFKTDEGPSNIPIDNVAELLPYYREQGMPYNALTTINGGNGYIKLKQPMDASSFNLKISNPQAFVRFVSVEQGNAVVNEVPVQLIDGGSTWQFAVPHLNASTAYALKVFFRGSAQTQAGNSPTQLVTRAKYAMLNYTVSDRDLIAGALTMKANEQEMLAWYFKTGGADNYQNKFNSMTLTKLMVGGLVADIKNTTAINLQNFDWAPNDATKTVKTLGAEYQFKATEAFNTMDANDFVRNKILPGSPQFTDSKIWGNMLTRAGLDPYFNNITAVDQLVDQFSLVAFGPGKKLKLDMPNTTWNAVVGDLHTTRSVEFPKLSALLQSNLYDINFKNNNYGQPAPNPAGGQSTAGTSNQQPSPTGSIINGINSGQLNGAINISGFSGLNLIADQPDYIMRLATSHNSGEGALSVTNSIMKNVVQEKKNLGYPGDIFSNLPGFGAAFDSMHNSGMQQTGTTMTIGAPAGLSAPKLNIAAPKTIQQR